MKIWIGPYTSFGYGYFDEIPAAYVMKYLDTTTAIEFVNMRLWTWKDGTQSIYVNANNKLLHPAHLNTEVVKVVRPAEGEEGKIQVTIRDAEGERVEEFDKLIVTTPLDWFAKFADAREEEKELFSKIIHEKYVDFIARFDENAGPTISGYIFDNMTYDRLGHAMVYYHRWEDLEANCPSVVYALRNHLGSEDVSYEYTIDTMIPVAIVMMLLWGITDLSGTLVLLVLLAGQLLCLGLTHTNSAIHDLLAGTVVVDISSQMIFRTTEDLIAYQKKVAAERASRQPY